MADSASGQSGTLARCLCGWPDGGVCQFEACRTVQPTVAKVQGRVVGQAGVVGSFFLSTTARMRLTMVHFGHQHVDYALVYLGLDTNIA